LPKGGGAIRGMGEKFAANLVTRAGSMSVPPLPPAQDVLVSVRSFPSPTTQVPATGRLASVGIYRCPPSLGSPTKGCRDVVVMDGPMPGLYEHNEEESWQSFRPFTSRLNGDMRDPNLKFVDLDGDGHADVLISEDAFVWHPSLAEERFGPSLRVCKGTKYSVKVQGQDLQNI